MKKTYITPETIETKIELQMLMTGSVPQIITPEGEDDEADPNGEVLSRRRRSPRNQWDDEEELSGENSEGLFY